MTGVVRALPAVAAAIADGRAVVALESSVFAQGLPIPANKTAARSMVEAVESRGAVAAITALVAPALFIALRLYILVPLAAGRVPHGFAICVRALHHASRWNMVEVFTIGVLLSLVRLSGLADAAPGPGLFALGAVTLLFAAIESAGTKHLWWQVR